MQFPSKTFYFQAKATEFWLGCRYVFMFYNTALWTLILAQSGLKKYLVYSSQYFWNNFQEGCSAQADQNLAIYWCHAQQKQIFYSLVEW